MDSLRDFSLSIPQVNHQRRPRDALRQAQVFQDARH